MRFKSNRKCPSPKEIKEVSWKIVTLLNYFRILLSKVLLAASLDKLCNKNLLFNNRLTVNSEI